MILIRQQRIPNWLRTCLQVCRNELFFDASSGRAFATATFLVGTGSVALGMGVASAMGVSSLQEFSLRMRELTEKNFPGLRRTGSEPDEDNAPDEAQIEFAKEWTRELEREEASGPWTESKAHAVIGNRVRTGLGLQGPK